MTAPRFPGLVSRLRLLAFLPAALFSAAIVYALWQLGWMHPSVLLLFAAPSLLLLVGLVIVPRPRGMRWIMGLLSVVSILMGCGLAAENWPLPAEDRLTLAAVLVLLASPILAWLPSRPPKAAKRLA